MHQSTMKKLFLDKKTNNINIKKLYKEKGLFLDWKSPFSFRFLLEAEQFCNHGQSTLQMQK